MWYEVEVGNSNQRLGNHRLALKNYNYIEKHFDQIYEDQFDFHVYSMRKFTIFAYFEMIEMEDKIYRNEYAVQAALGLIKSLKKVEKIKEEENKKNEEEFEVYKKSKEYQKLQQEIRQKENEDEYRLETDPEGYELYQSIVRINIE